MRTITCIFTNSSLNNVSSECTLDFSIKCEILLLETIVYCFNVFLFELFFDICRCKSILSNLCDCFVFVCVDNSVPGTPLNVSSFDDFIKSVAHDVTISVEATPTIKVINLVFIVMCFFVTAALGNITNKRNVDYIATSLVEGRRSHLKMQR